MQNLESNKIFAALLTAGVIAGLSGFASTMVVHPKHIEEDAYPFEVQEASSGGEEGEKVDQALALLATASADEGASIASKKCASCHSFDKGGDPGIGPNLWNVVGRAKGGSETYSKYSKGMMAMEGNWEYDKLSMFLTKPKDYVKKTTMGFAGLKKPEDRAKVIAYLRTLSDSPVALPGADAPAEEAPAEAPATEAAPE